MLFFCVYIKYKSITEPWNLALAPRLPNSPELNILHVFWPADILDLCQDIPSAWFGTFSFITVCNLYFEFGAYWIVWVLGEKNLEVNCEHRAFYFWIVKHFCERTIGIRVVLGWLQHIVPLSLSQKSSTSSYVARITTKHPSGILKIITGCCLYHFTYIPTSVPRTLDPLISPWYPAQPQVFSLCQWSRFADVSHFPGLP